MNDLTHVRFLGAVLLGVGLGPFRLALAEAPDVASVTPVSAERLVLWLCDEDQPTAVAYFDALRRLMPQLPDDISAAAIAALEDHYLVEAILASEPATLADVRTQFAAMIAGDRLSTRSEDLARHAVEAIMELGPVDGPLSEPVVACLVQSCTAYLSLPSAAPKRLLQLLGRLSPGGDDATTHGVITAAAEEAPPDPLALCRARISDQAAPQVEELIAEIDERRREVGLAPAALQLDPTPDPDGSLSRQLRRCEHEFVRLASHDIGRAINLNAAAARVRAVRGLISEASEDFAGAADHYARGLRHLTRDAAGNDAIGHDLAHRLLVALLYVALLEAAPDGLLKARDQAIHVAQRIREASPAVRLRHALLIATLELAVARRYDLADAFDQVARVTADLSAEARLARLAEVSQRAKLLTAVSQIMKYGQLGTPHALSQAMAALRAVTEEAQSDPTLGPLVRTCGALAAAYQALTNAEAGPVVLALADTDRAIDAMQAPALPFGPLQVMLTIDLDIARARLVAMRTLSEADDATARDALLGAADGLNARFRAVETQVSPATRALVHVDFAKLLAAASRHADAPELIATAASLTGDAMTTLAGIGHPLAGNALDDRDNRSA